MKNESPFNRVHSVLNPYIPINEKIDIHHNDLADIVFKIVKNKTQYEMFAQDPNGFMKKNGIDTSRMDLSHLKSVINIIQHRIEIGDLGRGAVQNSQKETSEGVMFNFDHSTRATTHYETQATANRGYGESTTTSESMNTDKNFAGHDIIRKPDDMLRHELNLIFFPGQPLVTPALVDKIKEQLKK